MKVSDFKKKPSVEKREEGTVVYRSPKGTVTITKTPTKEEETNTENTQNTQEPEEGESTEDNGIKEDTKPSEESNTEDTVSGDGSESLAGSI